MDKVKVTVSLPAELWERLKEIASENRRTYSAELTIAIEKHVKQEEE